MLTAIRQWVIKTMMKGDTGVIQTLPKREIIEMNVQITAQRMMQNGINPNDLKTVGQVENVVNQIEQPKVNVNPGMTSGKKADVLDMEGNKIDTSKGIMAGKEINQKNLNEELMKTDNPYSELVNTSRPKTLAEREADVLAGMEKNNKEMVQRIRDRKNKPLDPNDVLPDSVYNETPGEFTRRNTPGSKENLLQELKIAYEKDFNKLRGDETVEELQSILKDLDKNGEPFADGGRIGLLAGSVPKVLKFLKSKKKIDEAVNNIFPTGDYKYDAQMAADSLVENNPKIFGGKLYEDLDMDTQMEVYGAVIGPIQSNALAVSRMKKATRPEKTLASMKEGKGINMSDPDIADEFARFMKETDPKGTKELEQKLELSNFKTKDRSENADGGRIGLKSGLGKAFLEFLKKFKIKQSGDDVSEFLDKRKFLKMMVGETEKNKNARQLAEIKAAAEEARKNPGFKFKDVDIDKDIRPIFDQSKDRTLNSDGGRIGLKGGLSKAFIEFLKNTGKNMNNKSPIDAGKDYLKYIKDESIKGNSKAVAPGVVTIGAGGILANRFVGRKLEAMNEKQKEENLKRFIMELENDEFYQKYPDLKDETIASYTEKLFGEKKADGGRIGLKAGMTKRAFLKLMGGVGATIGAAKSGIFSGLGKGATKQAAKEVVQQTTSSMPPPYFFKLAEKIKNMGTEVTATTDRTISKSLLSKDGKSEYILEESVTSGDTIIKKVYKEEDMVTNVEIMSLKKGEDVVTKNGKPVRTPDEYEEVTETNSRIYKDEFNDPDYEDGINVDEIIKEVDDQAPPIKYASGGLAYMLGE